eukprot:5293261-Pyramimonas_sp.AAC.1
MHVSRDVGAQRYMCTQRHMHTFMLPRDGQPRFGLLHAAVQQLSSAARGGGGGGLSLIHI